MKKLLIGLTLLASMSAFADGQVKPSQFDCSVKDTVMTSTGNGSRDWYAEVPVAISKDIRKILTKKGYNFTNSTDSDVAFDVLDECSNFTEDGDAICIQGIATHIDGEYKSATISYIQSNPVNGVYHLISKSIFKSGFKDLPTCPEFYRLAKAQKE